MSAKYVKTLGLDYLGMTGKFHTSWGEFGGFKHPNALKYECAAMLAFGSKCSVGDQLHPDGEMDATTYEIIGEAYADVERKETWCSNVDNVADVGLLLSASLSSGAGRSNDSDTGAGRAMLEGHFLFDILDGDADFKAYRMIVMPDDVLIDATMKLKLDAYLANGGKLFLSGKAGLSEDRKTFLFDVGAETEGVSEFAPDYIMPRDDVRADFVKTPNVAYLPSQRIKATTGESLGDVYDPYFNRTYRHFCSHRHTPNRPEASGYDCGVKNGNIVYLAHPVFTLYRYLGAVAIRDYIVKAIRHLLDGDTVSVEGLPSTGRISLMDQKRDSRYVLHLLYANTILRGGAGCGLSSVEVVEELNPVYGITVTVHPPKPVSKVTLAPEGEALPFEKLGDGAIRFKLTKLLCHQMIVMVY